MLLFLCSMMVPTQPAIISQHHLQKLWQKKGWGNAIILIMQDNCPKHSYMSTLFLCPHLSLVLLVPTEMFCMGEDQSIQRATLTPASHCKQALVKERGWQAKSNTE